MLMQSSCRKNEKGIGLLELMLSLSIIAILLVMATRYFLVANESQRISNAVSMVNGYMGGISQYIVGSGKGAADISTTTLIDGGFIPASFGGSDSKGGGANPWGHDLTFDATKSPYTLKFSGVPSGNATPDTCTKLENALNGSIKGSATCSSGTVTVTINN